MQPTLASGRRHRLELFGASGRLHSCAGLLAQPAETNPPTDAGRSKLARGTTLEWDGERVERHAPGRAHRVRESATTLSAGGRPDGSEGALTRHSRPISQSPT